MTEEQLLLREIANEHESDSPRLVYADWLEDRGDSIRAEFVRLGCELAARQKNHAPLKGVQESYQRILNRKERQWVRDLKSLNIKKYEFNRGVIEKITINASRALCNVEEVFRRFPTVRSVKVTELHPVAKSNVDPFLELPCLQQLRSLDLSFSRIGGIEAEKIGQAKYLGNVENLKLTGNPIHQRGFESILNGQGLPNLRRLDISKCNLGEEFDATTAFDNPRFRGLEMLAASQMYWPQSSFEILADANMSNLNALFLGPFTGLTQSENKFRRQLDSSSFANLESLVVAGQIPAKLFRILCEHPMAKKIMHFVYSFSRNQLASFVKAEAIWTQLKQLGLGTLINEKEFKLILKTPKFSQLDWLGAASISLNLPMVNESLESTHNLKFSSIGRYQLDWPI